MPRGLDHSQSNLHYTFQRKKKKRKLAIQLTRMTILRNDKKRNANAKTEFGRTLIKNQQHIQSSKLFNG